MKPCGSFDTKRLRVWCFELVPPGGAELERTTYIGWLINEDQTYPVVVLTTSIFGIDMIWTHDFYRRKGLATELVKYVKSKFEPDLKGDGVSEEGEKFIESLGSSYWHTVRR